MTSFFLALIRGEGAVKIQLCNGVNVAKVERVWIIVAHTVIKINTFWYDAKKRFFVCSQKRLESFNIGFQKLNISASLFQLRTINVRANILHYLPTLEKKQTKAILDNFKFCVVRLYRLQTCALSHCPHIGEVIFHFSPEGGTSNHEWCQKFMSDSCLLVSRNTRSPSKEIKFREFSTFNSVKKARVTSGNEQITCIVSLWNGKNWTEFFCITYAYELDLRGWEWNFFIFRASFFQQ